jgi:hypothetical protein
MKTGRNILLLLLSTAFLVAACSKGGQVADDPHTINFSDTTFPVIQIAEPLDNQVFTSGDTIKIQGRVTDNSLFQGSINITDDANGNVVEEQRYEIHGFQLYDFAISYKSIVSSVTNYTVTVKYEDHGLNEVAKMVKVKVNP